MTNAFVLDASVAAKWFLSARHETLTAEATGVLQSFSRDEIKLLVPDLFWPEIGNVFWKAIKIGRMTRRSAEEAVATLREASLPTAPCLPILPEAFAISNTFDITVYDALYVGLAVARNHLLITADERLVNSLRDYFPVLWLGSAHLM